MLSMKRPACLFEDSKGVYKNVACCQISNRSHGMEYLGISLCSQPARKSHFTTLTTVQVVCSRCRKNGRT